MRDDILIRTVTVELLRAGPAHNQLLSPLTPYLGVCDDAEAGIVTLPYEQHTFERRMRAMRHEEKAVSEDKLPELRELGVAMAGVLGSIPRLPGALAPDQRGRDTLVRLSLTLSASELAALPFELAKVPVGPGSCTESWLLLQARVPVVITRRTRNVSVRDLRWLDEPRILFIASDPDPKSASPVPFAEHRQALIDAVTPFVPQHVLKAALKEAADGTARAKAGSQSAGSASAAKNRRERFGDLLTILSNASFDEVVRECARTCYTHVHILAHGVRDGDWGDRSFGLALHPDDGVISGERLASAFARVVGDRLHRPQVVTLCTCDSGRANEPINPGGSIAHVLHQAGIPLVVASQVPLGFEASILFTRDFYRGLLWGEHPWVLLHRVRSSLHGRLGPGDHDWASLVVYESLPVVMTEALEEARYKQCRTALDVAFGPDDTAWPETQGDPIYTVIDRLPVDGKYFGMEALALRADAQLEIGVRLNDDLASCLELERALGDYSRAVSGFLVSPGQGMTAPYRTVVAQLAIQAALGKQVEWGLWHMAWQWLNSTLQDGRPEDQVWAQGCLAELWLLRLLDRGADAPYSEACRAEAETAMRGMVRLLGRSKAESESSTWRFEQWISQRLGYYVRWWSNPQFEAALRHLGAEGPRPSWAGESGVRKLALDLLKILDPTPAHESAGYEQEAEEPDGAAQTRGEPPAAPSSQAPEGGSSQRLGHTAAPAQGKKTKTPASAQAGAEAGSKASAKASAKAAPKAAPKATKPAAGARFAIEMLGADQGDALWIEWSLPGGPTRRILVDCGTTRSYGAALEPRLEQLAKNERRFELFILSHIDSDHIEGALPMLQELPSLGLEFGDVWFNGRRHLVKKLGAGQGEAFSELIGKRGLPWNRQFGGGAVVRPAGELIAPIALADGMQLTLLSPVPAMLERLAPKWDEELKKKPIRSAKLAHRQLEPSTDIDKLAAKKFEPDPSRPNGSSIGVLAEFQGKSLLLGADVYAEVLGEALALLRRQRGGVPRLAIDAFKLPHHGSRNNLSVEVMQQLDCAHFLVSTNGDRHEHPDREAIARCLKYGAPGSTLWFNYTPTDTYHRHWFEPATQAKHGYTARHPGEGRSGIRIDLL